MLGKVIDEETFEMICRIVYASRHEIYECRGHDESSLWWALMVFLRAELKLPSIPIEKPLARHKSEAFQSDIVDIMKRHQHGRFDFMKIACRYVAPAGLAKVASK
jgi:hypothetical protein